jgi:hypothetical protein
MSLDPADQSLAETRRALHGVAELVLAGPQHAASHTVRLRVLPGGFRTTTRPEIRLEDGLIAHDGRTVGVSGTTPRELLEALGLPHVPLSDVYSDGADVGLDDRLVVDPAAYAQLTSAWTWGDAALRRLAPARDPVLWPEHFDVGIASEEVNYGVSPGDDAIAVPYAYVGPWKVPPADDFWTRPFGAARPVTDLGSADAVLSFFEEGRRRAGRASGAERGA